MTYAHLNRETIDLLDQGLGQRQQYLQRQSFVGYSAGLKALRWLSYLRRNEAGRDRPRSLHLIGVSGIGKSRLLSHYADRHTPGPRDSDGQRLRPVLLIEAPEDGVAEALIETIITGCVGVPVPRYRDTPRSQFETYLSIAGVRQLLIDEAGNLLNATGRRQQYCLAVLKRIINIGVTVGIATTANLKMVLAADEQLFDRFIQMELPLWAESDELRVFLAGVEQRLPLPAPSHLDSAQMVRWFIANGLTRTSKILDVIRDAAFMAMSEDAPCLNTAFLDRAASMATAPDQLP